MQKNALYYSYPYIKESELTVLSCEPNDNAGAANADSCNSDTDSAHSNGHDAGIYHITVDADIFYPEGGGQASDTGMIGDRKVLKAMEVKDPESGSEKIVLTVDGPLEVGRKYTATIDWAERFRNMQNHSGEHIISGLVHKYYGYTNVGFHMSDVITIDFDGVLTWEQILKIENECNEIIASDIEITEIYPTQDELRDIDFRSKKELTGDVRLVKIGDADLCACCGTHTHRTGEIGLVKMLSVQGHKGGVRIELVCGLDAVHDYVKKHDMIMELSRILSSKPELVLDSVKQLQETLKEKDGRIAKLNERYFEMLVDSYPTVNCEDASFLKIYETGLTPVELRKLCELFLKKEKGRVVVTVTEAQNGQGYMYVMGSRFEDVRAIGKTWNSSLSGRGGGSKEMIQGSVSATLEDIRSFCNIY